MIKLDSFEAQLTDATTVFECFGMQFLSLNSYYFQESFVGKPRISRKHIFIFFAIFSILLLVLCGKIFVVFLENTKQANENVNTGLTIQFVAYFAYLAVVLTHLTKALISGWDSMRIFTNLKKVFKVFRNELNESIEYFKFIKKIRNLLL